MMQLDLADLSYYVCGRWLKSDMGLPVDVSNTPAAYFYDSNDFGPARLMVATGK